MKPKYHPNGNITAHCPGCDGALANFVTEAHSRPLGFCEVNGQHRYDDKPYNRVLWQFVRCSNCSTGGVAKVHDNGNHATSVLEDFLPHSIERAHIPAVVPDDIKAEFREAELNAAHEAYRSGSAMLRSVLEKALTANGYTKGSLKQKIDDSAADGLLTEARRLAAQDNIRVLGNDILHDAWRNVDSAEFEEAHRYAQRILEDFYDDRPTVVKQLKTKGRLPPESQQAAND